MSTTWNVGDIVAEKRGGWYRSTLGVVVTVTKTRLKVDFGEGLPNTYSPATGVSTNQARKYHGWHVRPLDAECRKDLLECGFAGRRCRPAELTLIEKVARALRQEVLGHEVPGQAADK